jgi:hypothetical protein
MIANSFINTFAFDQPENMFDAISAVGEANAVSPDNMLLWDSLGPKNRNGFKSVYGAKQNVHFSPGDYKVAKICAWTFHPTEGTISGTVVSSAGSVQSCAVSVTGQPDVIVGADGTFLFYSSRGNVYHQGRQGYWRLLVFRQQRCRRSREVE